nr:hypothetical protein [Mucilaginibacter sp. FT3.2]
MYTNYIDIVVYLFHQIKSMFVNTVKYTLNQSLSAKAFNGMLCMCCC